MRLALVMLALVMVAAVACSSGDSEGTGQPTAAGASPSGASSAIGPGDTGGMGGTMGSPTAGTLAATAGAGAAAAGGTMAAAATRALPADFSVDLSLSPMIATVGIAEWSTAAPVVAAHIDFGRDASAFEYSAPVDLTAPNHRTLLLGMKPSTTYYVQVVVESEGATLTSEVLTLESGPMPSGLPALQVRDVDPSALFGAFTVTCVGGLGMFGQIGAAPTTWAFIFDRDGDYVWAYDISDTPVAGCSRARMSFDGKHMWIGNFSNVSPDGALMRVTMDGLATQDYSLPGRNHDFSVLPNNNILYYEQENGGAGLGATEGPDIIYELDPETGAKTMLYHENTDFSAQIAESGAHTNYIEYVPHLDAISFSLRHTNTIGVISYPDAELLMVFGGPLSDFPISWNSQHGHDLLDDSILIFNNVGTGGSSVLEYRFDLAAGTATKILDYSSGKSSGAFGDVQRLPNGNTFITYSTSGIFHEINAAGELLREITTDPVGYAQHRRTLYGPPPPHAN